VQQWADTTDEICAAASQTSRRTQSAKTEAKAICDRLQNGLQEWHWGRKFEARSTKFETGEEKTLRGLKV